MFFLFAEEYAQFYGAMNTMNGRMMTMRKDGLPYDEMGYNPPPNRFVLFTLKCNFSMNPHACLMVGLVCRSVIIAWPGSYTWNTPIGDLVLTVHRQYIFVFNA